MKSFLFYLILVIFINHSTQDFLNDNNQEKHQTRVIGGKLAGPKQFPYQVGIFLFLHKPLENAVNKGPWCGGTIISNQYVLTAAHCLLNDATGKLGFLATIYLGALDRHDEQEKGQRQIDVPPSNFIVHEGYNPTLTENDIALVRLPKPVNFDEYVQPARLPSRSYQTTKLDGKTLISSGWGRTTDKEDSMSRILQYITTQIVPSEKCFQTYSHFVPEKEICINAPGKTLCDGDSGGPNIHINLLGQKIVVGVSSYISKRGCKLGLPQSITRVSYYLDWISKNTGIEIY